MSPTTASRRARTALTTLALAVLTALPASADGNELEDARRQFREALSQEAAGDWAGALAKLEEVARVKLTAQVRYHIARCKEHLGRFTEALGDYRIAEFEAQKSEAPELSEITRARTDLEGRVPRLQVVLPKRAAGATVELDGVALGAAQLAQDIPVNPGAHRLVARIGKGSRSEKTFTASEGEVSRVRLSPKAPGAAESDDAAAADEPATPAQPAPAVASSGGSAWPWVAASVGVVGLVGAGVFYGLRSSAESDLNDTCRGDLCPQSLQATQDRSDRYRTFTGVALGVGVLGLGTAAVLWLSGDDAPPKQEAARAGVRLDAQLGAGFASAGLRGAF